MHGPMYIKFIKKKKWISYYDGVYSQIGVFVHTTNTSLLCLIWITNIQTYRMIVLKSIDNFWKIVYKMSSGIAEMMEWTFKARQWTRWRRGQCVFVCCMYLTELSWLFVKAFSLKEFSASKHQGLVLCPSCVPEKVGVN